MTITELRLQTTFIYLNQKGAFRNFSIMNPEHAESPEKTKRKRLVTIQSIFRE